MPTPVLGATTTGDVYLVSFWGTLANQRIINTFYYEMTAVPTTPEDRWSVYSIIDAAFSAAGGIIELFLNSVSSSYNLEEMRVQVVSPVRKIYRSFGKNLPGERAGGVTAPNLAASIERRTEQPDRRGVGRLQVAGLVPSDVVDGMLEPAVITLLELLAVEMLDSIIVGDAPGNAAPALFGIAGDGSHHSDYVVDTSVKTTVRTMHRRTVGLGI